jgi:hypothetical protein
MIGGRRFVVDGARGLDVSTEREGEFEMDGRLFCNRFCGAFSSGDPKVKAPDPPKLIRLSLDEEVERDQRFTVSISSMLGRRRTSADVTGRASLKSKPLYSGAGRLGWG